MTLWTSQDIQHLMNGFLTGTPHKALARELGRSPSALNKALARFGIRQARQKKACNVWNNFGQHAHTPAVEPRMAIARFDRRFRKIQDTLTRQHANMTTVMCELERRGHIVVVDCVADRVRDTRYVLDGAATTALKLIFLANRYRIQNNLPPYLVEEVLCQ